MDILPRGIGNGTEDQRKGVRTIFILILGIMIGVVVFSQWRKYISPPGPIHERTDQPVPTESGVPSAVLPERLAHSPRRTRATDIFSAVSPAVVSVHTERIYTTKRRSFFGDPFFDAFFYDPRLRQYKISGLGSGFIVNEGGYILTNEHVVHDAVKILVILPDGREFEATLINADFMSDVAVLKIEGENLPRVKLGNSEDILIGEDVLAIGNPFGNLLSDEYGRFPLPSVSQGIVSAVNRNFRAPRDDMDIMYRNMIQTDAAINKGNSGGPLVNFDGEVIGVNTVIFTEEGSFKNVGFALPIDRVKILMDEILQYGEVRRVKPGLSVRDLDRIYAGYLGLKIKEGVIVTNVAKDSPAERAGLKITDVIVEVNNKKIRNYRDISGLFRGALKGDAFQIKYIRKGKIDVCRLVL